MRRDTFDGSGRLIMREDDVARTVTEYDPATGTPTRVREYSPEEAAAADARQAGQPVDRASIVAQGITSLRQAATRLETDLSTIAGTDIPAQVPQMVRQARALLTAASASLRGRRGR